MRKARCSWRGNRPKRYGAMAMAAVCMAGFGFPTFAMGGGPDGDGPGFMKDNPRREARQQQMFEDLDLTPEQIEQFKAAQTSAREESKAIFEQVKAKRTALMTYLESPDANKAEAKAKSHELGELMQQLGDIRVNTLFEIKSILNDEQYAEFVAHRKAMHEKFGKRFKGRRGGGQGNGQGRGGGQGQGRGGGPNSGW